MCIRDSPWVAPVYGLADGVGVGPRVGVGDGVVAVPPVAQAATARAAVATSAAIRPTRAGRGVRTGTRFLRGGEIKFGVGAAVGIRQVDPTATGAVPWRPRATWPPSRAGPGPRAPRSRVPG